MELTCCFAQCGEVFNSLFEDIKEIQCPHCFGNQLVREGKTFSFDLYPNDNMDKIRDIS